MDKFAEMLDYLIMLANKIACLQEEMAPELWSVLADSFLKQVNVLNEQFDIENDFKQIQRESKYKAKLQRRGWKKRIALEFKKNKTNDRLDMNDNVQSVNSQPNSIQTVNFPVIKQQ